MLGSLTFYRRVLNDNVFTNPTLLAVARASSQKMQKTAEQAGEKKLPTIGHAMAGVMAGATVSFVAAPVEHVKARLQVQYAAEKSRRLYRGPVDCFRKIVRKASFKYYSFGIDVLTVPCTWYTWHLSRPVCNPPVSVLFLLLVGILRYFHPLPFNVYKPINTRNKLLGWRPFCTGLLAYFIPVRCC